METSDTLYQKQNIFGNMNRIILFGKCIWIDVGAWSWLLEPPHEQDFFWLC